MHLETSGVDVIDMPSKNITFSVDEDLYNRYWEFCKKKGWLISRQSDIMIEGQIEGGTK